MKFWCRLSHRKYIFGDLKAYPTGRYATNEYVFQCLRCGMIHKMTLKSNTKVYGLKKRS
jgi:hypothetical protein